MAMRQDEVEGANFGPYLYSIENEAERLDVLFRAYHADVRRFCERTIGAVHADDAAQEIMLKVVAKLPQYRRGEPFRPWLNAIATNVCRDFGRAEVRIIRLRDRQSERGGAVTLMTAASDDDCPEEAFRRRANAELVIEALLQLPELSRKMLYWQVYEGLSYDEIARRAHKSRNAVRSILTRAKKTLREQLEASGGSASDWRGFAVVGAGLGVVRRLRARSRAWLFRNSPRGSSLAVEGAPLNVALMARATEVVAAGVVALGALTLPSSGGMAAGPIHAPAMAPLAAVHAPPSTADHTHSQAATTAAGGHAVPNAPVETRATELKVSSPDGSGPAQTATVERERESIVVGEELSGPLPVVGEDYSSRGKTEFGCGGPSGEVVCGTYDRLPLGS